jgi:hypothetical protein
MVTSALWSAFNNDGHVDLMAAGEWMQVNFFKNKGGKLVNVNGSTGLGETSDWWSSVAGDGKGNFVPLSAISSGLALHGDNRSLVELHTQHGKVLLIGASNSGKLEVYVQ